MSLIADNVLLDQVDEPLALGNADLMHDVAGRDGPDAAAPIGVGESDHHVGVEALWQLNRHDRCVVAAVGESPLAGLHDLDVEAGCEERGERAFEEPGLYGQEDARCSGVHTNGLHVRSAGYNSQDVGMAEREPLILVVDAHELVASSLAVALEHAGFRRVASIDPDALFLDGDGESLDLDLGDIVLVGLLYGDGRTTLPLIGALVHRACRVLVMASDQGLPLAGECLHRGAEAVLNKGMSFERLVSVLQRLGSGGCAMTEEERSGLLESVARHEEAGRALQHPFQALTKREAEIFAALVAGMAPKQIAVEEGISVSTVRGHIQGVLSKLDVRSQREALAAARHAGWP